MELEGAFAPTRDDFLKGASVTLESFLVTSKGVDRQTLDAYLESGLATIHRKEIVSKEERDKRNAEKNRSWFYALKGLLGG